MFHTHTKKKRWNFTHTTEFTNNKKIKFEKLELRNLILLIQLGNSTG